MKSPVSLLLVFFLAFPGCYTVKFVSPEALAQPAGPTFQTWTNSLFWGLVPLGKVSLDGCGDAGVRKMHSQIGGLGLIAYALTGGIWTPMHVHIQCAGAKSTASNDLDSELFLADPATNDGGDGTASIFLLVDDDAGSATTAR